MWQIQLFSNSPQSRSRHYAVPVSQSKSMGHGASTTNIKKISLNNDVIISNSKKTEQCKTPRSSSDGCIVETLNSSKCKADLIELQLDELKDLLRQKETQQAETEEKAKLLEKQLAEVEGKNFELTDRVSDLEQQLAGFETNDADSLTGDHDEIKHLEEQLESKEQQIMKLEDQINSLETDMKKLRSKFKKRIKAVQTETAEARQESALKVYSLKDDIKRLEEENTKLIARLDRASSATRSRQGSAGISQIKSPVMEEEEKEENNNLDEWEDTRTKLIVELSSQVNTQDELMADLRNQLEEKDVLLKELRTAKKNRPPSGQTRVSSSKSDRPSSHKKSHWGYPADPAGAVIDPVSPQDDRNDYQWSPTLEDDDEFVKKPSSREGSRKSSATSSRDGSRKASAQSQRSYKETDDSVYVEPLRTKKSHSSRTGSGSKKSSRNSSAISSDSVLSDGDGSHGDDRSRTSSAQSTGSSSRQRRRLHAALEESTRLSPHRTDSAFSESSEVI